MDLVSVVVPCYNSFEFVEDTLESIAQQTHENIDVVLVDDGGTDRTIEILTAFSRRDKRFRVVQHRANSGLSAARNTGARAAFGKYICFIDSDDLMMRESVQVRVEAIKNAADPRNIGSYCGSLTIPESASAPPPMRANPQLRRVDYISSLGRCPFNANQPMFIKADFQRMGGFSEYLRQAEDYELWMRILRAGFHIAPAKFDAVTYRTRQSSLIRENPLQHAEYSTLLQRTFYEDLGAEGEYKISPAFHSKAGQEYLLQSHNYNRILEFAGMAIGKDQPIQEVVDFIVENLPDVLIFHSDQRFRERLRHGVSRYFAHDAWLVNSRSEVIDEVVAATAAALTRKRTIQRKTSTDEQLGITWAPGHQRHIDVLFFPHKDYHVWTINLLRPALEQAGVEFAIVDLSGHYRDEGVRQKAAELKLPLVGYGNFALGDFEPRLLVAFNDWDPIVRSIFACAQTAGIATASIVEGIQDYLDADTGRIREPYRSSDLVLVPGEHDLKYFEGSNQDVRIGGVPRIAELLRSAPTRKSASMASTERPTALINSNFSYGVLTEHRDTWLKNAVETVQSAGFVAIVSRHPADIGEIHPELVSERSFYAELADCDVVVQRFASGVLEALAFDKPVIYFNPHNEQVDKFKSPNGAFRIANNETELATALQASLKQKPNRADVIAYLNFHCNASDQNIPLNITNILSEYLSKKQRSSVDYIKFNKLLLAVDRLSKSLSNVKILQASFPAAYGQNPRDIEQVFESIPDILHDTVTKPIINGRQTEAEDEHEGRADNDTQSSTALQVVSTLHGRPARPINRRSALLSKLARDPHRYFSDSNFAPFRLLRFFFRPYKGERSAALVPGLFIDPNPPLSKLSMSAQDSAAHFNALFNDLKGVDAKLRSNIKTLSIQIAAIQEEMRTAAMQSEMDKIDAEKFVASKIRELDWKLQTKVEEYQARMQDNNSSTPEIDDDNDLPQPPERPAN